MRIGIDLGTTYSLIATLNRNGVPVLLPDAQDKESFHTPSNVCFTPDGALVGYMAENHHAEYPELSPLIRFFKRHLDDDKPLSFDPRGQEWFPEAIAALVLKKLLADARRAMPGEDVESAVITVPAHFGDRQRQAVLDAAALAEIPQPSLVDEPVAAALHYGYVMKNRNEGQLLDGQLLMVYDLGGGTFDVTLFTMNSKETVILAKDGETNLGGKEFDDALSDIILTQFEQTRGAPLPPDALDARSLLQLRRQAEEVKIRLCIPSDRVTELVTLGQEAIEVQITRGEFEAAVLRYVEQTEAVVMRCLEDAGRTLRDVQVLLLVGGSSMTPMIQKWMERRFHHPGQQVLFHEPTRAVALGAALRAYQLSGAAERYQIPPILRGVTGYHVGVEVFDARTGRLSVDRVLKKGTPFSAATERRSYYADPNQDTVVFNIVQYQDDPRKARSRGQLVIGPLPPHQQSYRIEVEIENLDNGTIAARAYDPHTRKKLTTTFGHENQDGQARLARQKALVLSTPVNGLL